MKDERAQVTSVEALTSFRANLIIFLSKARPTLDEIGDEVRSARDWLQQDRWHHWQNEVRRRRRAFEQAQQALFSAKLSSLQEPTTAQQWAVTRAQQALHEAEEKLRHVRKWMREFENLTAPLTRQIDQVNTILSGDMQQAIAYLAQVIEILETYADKPL